VTIQAQIIALLRDLQRDFGTAIVMITHDLGVVAGLCDEVIVLYGGRIMEQGSAESIFYRPSHPYTVGLLGAVPRLEARDQALVAIPGVPPNMSRLPAGCPFSERCTLVGEQCRIAMPPLVATRNVGEEASDVLRACFKTPAEVLQSTQAKPTALEATA
jgi:oligopeptide transport system ATP-binding protein